jgi:hypothetical protein
MTVEIILLSFCVFWILLFLFSSYRIYVKIKKINEKEQLKKTFKIIKDE